jgi:type IV pilus assembly protein PilW
MRAGAGNCRGLSIVELLIAMLLGLLVTGAVFSMYVGTSRNLTQDERYSWLQESGRYALKVIAEDLSMAGFWGPLVNADEITASFSPPTGGCADSIALNEAATGLRYNNYHTSPATTQFSPCTTVLGHHRPGTDVLVVKRVRGQATARTFVDTADSDGDGNLAEQLTTGAGDLGTGTVYLRTNGTSGALSKTLSSAAPPALGESDWQYIPRIYFVRDYLETVGDGIPALCRLDLSGAELSTTQCLAEGIEDLHVVFGLDSNGDGAADQYTAAPAAAQMQEVVTARIHLLARSVQSDPHYTNAKTYQLGDVTVAAAGDGHYRRVFSTTVAVRNVIHRNLIDLL